MAINRIFQYFQRPKKGMCWRCDKRRAKPGLLSFWCQQCIDEYEADRPAREAAKILADQWEKDRWPKMGDR